MSTETINSRLKPIIQNAKQIKRLLKIFSGEALGKVLIAVGSHRHLAGSDDISLSHARM